MGFVLATVRFGLGAFVAKKEREWVLNCVAATPTWRGASPLAAVRGAVTPTLSTFLDARAQTFSHSNQKKTISFV